MVDEFGDVNYWPTLAEARRFASVENKRILAGWKDGEVEIAKEYDELMQELTLK